MGWMAASSEGVKAGVMFVNFYFIHTSILRSSNLHKRADITLRVSCRRLWQDTSKKPKPQRASEHTHTLAEGGQLHLLVRRCVHNPE